MACHRPFLLLYIYSILAKILNMENDKYKNIPNKRPITGPNTPLEGTH